MHSVNVNLSGGRSYPIVVGHSPDWVSQLPELGRKVVIVTHPSLPYADKIKGQLSDYDVDVLYVPEGESSKNLDQVSELLDRLLERKLERSDTLIGVGGGVIGDLTGFVASIYLRGINFIQYPTSLLAQVDAAIGGKTGVNHPKGKNLIGAFYQPRMVVCDLDTLSTLPEREYKSGMAEVVKYGVIRNTPLFEALEAGREDLELIVYESAKDKAFVVSEDEREAELRAILNFGHTIGHGIEAVCGYSRYTHGECVAVGMVAATEIAIEMGICDVSVKTRLEAVLEGLGFDLKVTGVNADDVFEAMSLDKKVKSGKIRFVLPTSIGTVVIRDDVGEDLMRTAIAGRIA